jgi:hypothetical protein
MCYIASWNSVIVPLYHTWDCNLLGVIFQVFDKLVHFGHGRQSWGGGMGETRPPQFLEWGGDEYLIIPLTF